MHARIGLPPQVIIRLQQNLEKSREVFFTEQSRRLRQRWTLIRGRRNQFRIRPARSRDQQIAHVPDRFPAEVLQIAPFLLERMHQPQGAVCRPFCNRADQFLQRIIRHHAQQFAHLFVGNGFAAIGPCLFQQRQGIAQTAFGHSRNHRHRARFDLQIFFFRDLFQSPRNLRKGQRAKMKVLRPRADRIHQVFRLRRGHHKDHAVRRFFERLQQCV